MKAHALERKFTVQEVAEQWGFSIQQLYRLVHHRQPSKRIPHVRIGGAIYFEATELEAWLEARRKRPAPPADVVSITRQRKRSHEEECRRLGIEPDHEFAAD